MATAARQRHIAERDARRDSVGAAPALLRPRRPPTPTRSPTPAVQVPAVRARDLAAQATAAVSTDSVERASTTAARAAR